MQDAMVVTKQTQSPRDESHVQGHKAQHNTSRLLTLNIPARTGHMGTIDLAPPLNRGSITLKATQEKETIMHPASLCHSP